jgi:uncharacterized UPF0160 family protein
MNWFKNKKTIAVHDGNFHPDDVFAVAILSILEKGRIKIIRTRDQNILNKMDYVLDVGGKYDSVKNKFDHHQSGGAGQRDVGIRYSTFGLLWKKYGVEICGSEEIANVLDKKLVVTIDADDNGFNLFKNTINNLSPFTLTDIIYSARPTWKEDAVITDKLFAKEVIFAKEIILREIKVAKDKLEIIQIIQGFYKKSQDKKIIVIDDPEVSRYDVWDALLKFPEPFFVVYKGQDSWAVVAMKKAVDDCQNRKDFPVNWAGLMNEELANISGVPDALFCHISLFLSVARSKEGAIKMANIAINS